VAACDCLVSCENIGRVESLCQREMCQMVLWRRDVPNGAVDERCAKWCCREEMCQMVM
jgi:hypothetical protein